MKIVVRVTANSKKPRVCDGGATNFVKVWVDAPAVEGRANKRLLEILSECYNRPKTSFVIRRGLRSRNKIIEIRDQDGNER